jgi:hypothetical protein
VQNSSCRELSDKPSARALRCENGGCHLRRSVSKRARRPIRASLHRAAYAQRLGATGLTFFDDDVINFFSPHAKGKSAIFLLAIGKPLKRKPQ